MMTSAASSCSTSSNSLLPPISSFSVLQSTSDRHISVVEYAALKAELRKTRNEK